MNINIFLFITRSPIIPINQHIYKYIYSQWSGRKFKVVKIECNIKTDVQCRKMLAFNTPQEDINRNRINMKIKREKKNYTGY